MRTIVVVCIYNRYDNLKKWVHAWSMCEKQDSALFIVNNADETMDTSYWERYCKDRGVHFIRRQNIGFETGVIQDVLLGTMFKEQNWDIFLFATDDTLPMKKDFLRQYIDQLENPDIGIACMELSGIWTPHIRTTGWAIKKDVAKNLYFVHYPIQTKEQCYFFEHQGFEDTLMSQVLKMDKRIIQLSSIKNSVMWDTHHTKLNRWEEWNKEFPGF